MSATPASRAAEMLAALERARAERLVPFRTENPLLWECHGHTIRVTGEHAQDVACSCPHATLGGHFCKHMAVVVFARKYGLRPIRLRVVDERASA